MDQKHIPRAKGSKILLISISSMPGLPPALVTAGPLHSRIGTLNAYSYVHTWERRDLCMQAEIFEIKRIMQAVDMGAGYNISGQEEA